MGSLKSVNVLLTIDVEQQTKGIFIFCFQANLQNAFCISSINKCFDIRALIIIFQRFGCRAGPLYMQSFMLLANGLGFALASKTILTLAFDASSLHIGHFTLHTQENHSDFEIYLLTFPLVLRSSL